jgi:NitT/TauT family transport system ATP-binding protein
MATQPGAPAVKPRISEKRNGAGAAIRIESLSHRFDELAVIAELSLSAPAAGVVGLVGPSGCGKSTLLELVSGLREQRAGVIEVEGESAPAARLARCAYMPQRDLLLPWLEAIDNAALALTLAGASRQRARQAVRPLFERFGLGGFEAATPGELSGGMRQRVAFLRTLAAGKPVLLLDEPFASLDAITRAEMQSWLVEALAAEGRTVLLVSHDVEEALYLCDRVLVLSNRPARVIDEIEVPGPRHPDRAAAVSSPEFARLRERALRELTRGAR